MNKKLTYNKPASCWNEALPLGNGELGAMVYGDPVFDRIGLSSDTLWAGHPKPDMKGMDMSVIPEVRRLIGEGRYTEAQDLLSSGMPDVYTSGYVTAGELFIERFDAEPPANGYHRSLDLETAVYSDEYSFTKLGLDRFYHIIREIFVSHPDRVLVYRMKGEGGSSYRIGVTSPHVHSISAEKDSIYADCECPSEANDWPLEIRYGSGESVRYRIAVKVVAKDGKPYCAGSEIWLRWCSDFTVYVAIETSFNGFDRQPVSQGKEYKNKAVKIIELAASMGFETLKERHISDYAPLFGRVSLCLGDADNRPTDELIKDPGPSLDALLFDFGRYLTIAGSRSGSQPLNLQGIWINMALSPWNSNYTMNINTEMNYWPTEACDLPECHEPLFGLVYDLSSRGNCLGLPGWAAWHNSDLWRFNRPATNGVLWGFWVWGGVWECRHLWEHYQFTLDKNFLEKVYPIFAGALDFIKAWVVKDENGCYTTCPSTSPENALLDGDKEVSALTGSAMDLSLIRDICSYTEKAAVILGKDFAPYKDLSLNLAHLEINDEGRLKEWHTDLPEAEKGHRHLSHLYGVYPADVIKPDTPEWEAAYKSLLYRIENGGGHTGWSNAWIACLFARFGKGENAHKCIENMYKKSIYPNMFDAHPPFQIDGNFGITAAIIEMLVSSCIDDDGTVILKFLPALPKCWSNGSLRGVRCRGGIKADIRWENGELVSYHISAPEHVRYRVI